MAGLLTNKGEVQMLALLFNKSGYTLNGCTLRLFKNDYTPVEGTLAADLTEADFTGYSAAAIATGDVTLAEGAPSSATLANKTFTRSSTGATQNIYGWYITEGGGGLVMAAERFSDAPNAVTNNGDNIQVQATITQD